jgi:hypothetical protein
MTGWATVPPWVYKNDLPAEALQRRWVEQWERTWAARVEARTALEREIHDLRAMKRRDVTAEMWSALVDELGERYDWLEDAVQAEAEALAFLEEARRRLADYQRRERPRRG